MLVGGKIEGLKFNRVARIERAAPQSFESIPTRPASCFCAVTILTPCLRRSSQLVEAWNAMEDIKMHQSSSERESNLRATTWLLQRGFTAFAPCARPP